MKQGLFWTGLGLLLGASLAWLVMGPPQSLQPTGARGDKVAESSRSEASPHGL